MILDFNLLVLQVKMDISFIGYNTDRWRRLVFWCFKQNKYKNNLSESDKYSIDLLADYVLSCSSTVEQRKELEMDIKSIVFLCKLNMEVAALQGTFTY